jgi:WD40 repeat protein
MENSIEKSMLRKEERELQDGLKMRYQGGKLIERVEYEDILEGEINKFYEERREESSLIGHNLCVCSVAFNPNRNLIASGSRDKTIRIWNLKEKQEEYSLIGHTDSVSSVAFSPNGKYLASSSDDSTIKLWDLTNRIEEYSLIGHSNIVHSIVFSFNGNYLFSGSKDKTIKIWDLAGRKEEYSFNNNSEVFTIAVSLDGNYLAAGSQDKTVKVWNLLLENREECSFTGHSDLVCSVSFHPNGKYLASGSYDKTIKIWNILEKKENSSLSGHTSYVYTIAFNPNGNYLASGSEDRTIKIWNLKESQEEYSLIGHGLGIRSVSFSSDGRYLATSSEDKIIKIWNLAETQEESLLIGHSSCVFSVAFSPNGKYLASASEDKKIKIWDTKTHVEEYSITYHADIVRNVAFSPDSKYLASGSEDRTIKIWNLIEKKEECTFDSHNYIIRSVAFSPDGNYLASGSWDKTIKIWNLTQKREKCSLIGHTDSIYSVVFIPGQPYLASASQDTTIKVWNLVKAREEYSLAGHTGSVYSVASSSDGKYLASASGDKTIKVWNLRVKREAYSFSAHASQIRSVAFSPDGQYLASASYDKTVKIWNLLEKREEYLLIGHTEYVYSVAFSPNGKYLASASQDKTIKMWNLAKNRRGYSQFEHIYHLGSYLIKQATNFLENINNVKRTKDDKYELYYENQSLKLFTQAYYDSSRVKYYFIGPSSAVDIFYQKKGLFYNLVDAIKSKKFNKLIPSTNNLILTEHLYNTIHFICYMNQPQALKKCLNQDCVLKADLFGKSPFYYCIKKNYQECVDYLLIFLTSLLTSKDQLESTRVRTSIYAIRNDFRLIIEKSSSFLTPFLEKLILNSRIIFGKVIHKLPFLKNSKFFSPAIEEFIDNKEDPEEAPLVLKTIMVPLQTLLNSQDTIDLVQAFVNCKNKTIFKTQMIQYYIKFQWENLIKWVTFYSILVFLNMGFLLLIRVLGDYKVYGLVLFSITNLLLLLWEFLQMIGERFEYFKSIYNMLDMPRIILTTIWIILEFCYENLNEHYEYRLLSLLVSLLNFIRSFTGFTLFNKTRYYIRLISMALNDIIYFLIIFVYTTLSFGIILFSSEKEANYNLLWVEAFALNFGSSGLGLNFSEDTSLEYFVFFLATIINVVLMLNLLISILGDSFNRFQENRSQFDYEERAEFVLEVLRIRLVFYPCIKWAEGKYLHICISYDENLDETNENQSGSKDTDINPNKDNKLLENKLEITHQDVRLVKQDVEIVKKRMESIEKKLEDIIKFISN